MDAERLMWSILGKVLGKVVSWEGILANFLLGCFCVGVLFCWGGTEKKNLLLLKK